MGMIYQGPTNSFKLGLLQGIHDLNSDALFIALYSESAELGPATTVYTASGEVTGTGYSAGGTALTANIGSATQLGKFVATVDFADVSWPASTITARGALIYNSSKANRAIWVLNFGHDRVSNSSTFPIVFPDPDFLNALIRL